MTATVTAPVTDVVTAAERFIFETQGYLVLENFLQPGHIARLLAATATTVARRREQTRTDA